MSNTLKEELISFETAKLAKEKGFSVFGHFSYGSDGKFAEWEGKYDHNKEPWSLGAFRDHISAPSQSLLQKWIWKIHSIWIEITLWGDGLGFICLIKQAKGKEKDGSTIVRQIGLVDTGLNLELRSDPYKLLEKALQEALKLIEQ